MAWIEERAGLAVRTVELYQGLLRNHIDPYIGDLTLAELSPAKVRKWRKGRLDDKVGEVTVAKAYRLLKAIMNTALADDKLIKSNPCTIKGAGIEDSPERPTATIEQALQAADVPNLHLHDLRHTGNTLAAETGATLRELMDRMGHASTRAALIYLHAREQRGHAIAAGIDAMVSKATKKPSRKARKAEKSTK